MIKNIALFSVIAASSVAMNALAVETKVEDKKDYYVQFNTGPSFGTLPRGEFVNSTKSSTTPVFAAELGYKYDDQFRAGFELGYRPNYTFKDSETSTEFDGVQTTVHTSKYKVKSFTAMTNAYYDILTTNDITPYVTAGMGLARNTVKEKQINYTVASEDGVSVSETKLVNATNSKTMFAFKLGFGAKYKIDHNFDLDLRYQYSNLGKLRVGKTSVSGAENGKLYSQEVILGAAYKF